ncbi:Arc-like DNA binding domain protein [Pirellula sp. SH-Sr6A]|uniref:Arc family DNA-binding protein n=1 Tax=Pirellula sp. SH-Sr6A TaxID=1632865 RepID=UPI00078B6426|nr:Arc family DNA-binding protein [Pirellula sp. SH-Sr6A]AMV32257.1 Arc-like DNA binding domain protein [Pirellula sp. SH-Sr6A]
MAKRDSFLLRLPPETLDALRRWAEEELRSTNSQIETLLTHALKKAGRYPKPTASPGPSPTLGPKDATGNEGQHPDSGRDTDRKEGDGQHAEP